MKGLLCTISAVMIKLLPLQTFKFGLYVTVPISLYVFVAYFPGGLDFFVNKVDRFCRCYAPGCDPAGDLGPEPWSLHAVPIRGLPSCRRRRTCLQAAERARSSRHQNEMSSKSAALVTGPGLEGNPPSPLIVSVVLQSPLESLNKRLI